MLYAAAERLFREAIAINPTDPKPYHQLLTAVFAERKDLDSAKELVADGLKREAPALPLYLSLAEAAHKAGDPDEREAALESAKAEADKLIKNGENPYTLYIALADGARRAGDRDRESSALLKALDRHPRAPETLLRLANVYLEKRNYDRASMYLNRVAGITPNSADLFYRIGLAEEAGYRFAAAGRAYGRALELAPNNAGYRERYDAFRERVERNRSVANATSVERGAGSGEPEQSERLTK
jgi:tetratricopeptide (TPR) repeat protein